MQPRGWSPLIRFLNQDHMRAMQRFRMADVSLRFPRKSGRNTTIGMASPGPRRCWAAAATLRRNIVAAVLWRNIATPLDLLILRLTACKMSKSNALQPISASQPSNPLTLRESGARMSKSNAQVIQIEPPHIGSAHSARLSSQNEQIGCGSIVAGPPRQPPRRRPSPSSGAAGPDARPHAQICQQTGKPGNLLAESAPRTPPRNTSPEEGRRCARLQGAPREGVFQYADRGTDRGATPKTRHQRPSSATSCSRLPKYSEITLGSSSRSRPRPE